MLPPNWEIKDGAAAPDLVKAKDKKISELEEQLCKSTAPEWSQMLAVQQDYKVALEALLGEGKRRSTSQNEAAAKVARMED